MTDATYNGRTNYETWAVGMFLDGNYTGEGTYQYTIETVTDALQTDHPTSEYWTADESRRYHVADALKDMVGEATEPEEPSLASDLIGVARQRVNWYELADAWIENVREQVTS